MASVRLFLLKRWRLLAPTVALLAVLPAISFADTAGTSRTSAVRAALAALGANRGTRPQAVFSLNGPVDAGTVISVGGPAHPSRGGFASSARRVLVRVARASWFFYQDLAPYQQYAHPGRVALVDTRSGRVWVSGTISWPPFVNGSLPAFLRTQGAYDGSRYRVFSRPYRTSGGVAVGHLELAGDRVARSEAARLDPTQAGIVSNLLASQHGCVVAISADSVPGGYYRFARVQQSHAALDLAFSQLAAFSTGFSSSVYPAHSSLSPTGFLARQIAGGCRDVLVYLAGGGYPSGGPVNIGMGMVGSRLVFRDLTLSALQNLVTGHPTVHFEFVIDAPHASSFQSLTAGKNVLLVATPVAPGGGSFAYLPEAVINGRLVLNTTDPLHLLQLTNRLLFGLDTVIDNASEISQLRALVGGGKVPSALAFLVARALGDGGAGDFTAAAGLASPPQVSTQGFTAGTPPVLTATPDSYTAGISAPVVVPASSGVLANDSDSARYPITVDELNGAGGTAPLHGTSAKGAAVTLNADGSFTYDPSGSLVLQALRSGQTAVDSFTYHAVDGHGGSGTATVTITVAGVNRPPVLSGIESSALSYTAGTPALPVSSTLVVTDPRNMNLSGATVSITSGFAAGEDSLGFVNQNGITGSYDSSTGVLTLSGTAPVADYQAALRSVTFSDPNGTSPTTGTRTIAFQGDNGLPPNNLSNVASRDVQVGPNPPPVASGDTASTDKHTAIDIPVLANDFDPDGDALSVSSVDTTGTKGSVSINRDGTIHYDPNGQFNGLQQGQTATDTFSYRATDGYHDSNSATVTVTINGVNDPPVLANIESSAVSYDAGTPPTQITNSLTVSDDDDTNLQGATVSIGFGFVPAEDSLQFTSQNGITGSYDSSTGVLTLSGSASLAAYQSALRSVTYRDSNGATPSTGTRTISFQVDDGHTANNLSNVESRNVTVNPNPPPVAVDDSASTDKHTAIDINVLANDSDSDGDPVSVASVDTTGTKGLVSINPDGTIHYDPNGQFNGLLAGQTATDTFTYTDTDGFQSSSPATVTITINGVNDPPVLANIESSTLQYDGGTPATPVTSNLTVASPDTTTLAGATASISSGFAAGEDSLGFINQNGITGSYNSSTGVLTLSGTSSVADYQAALRSVTFSDPNGTSPTTGTRAVSFQVDDGLASNNLSNVASRDVQVNPNPPPVATNDSATTDKHSAIDIPVLANDSDPDGDALSVSSVDTTGTLGSVSVNPDGTIHYDPNGAFNTLQEGQTATDTFTYTDTDGFHTSNAATVVVTINGSNDAPVLSNIETSAVSYSAGAPATQVTNSLTVSDDDDTNLQGATASIVAGFVPSEDSLQFTSQSGITGSYDSSTGVLTLSGSASLAAYQSALRSVTYRDSNGATPSTGTRTIGFQVDDGHSSNNLSNVESRSITVNPNSAPVAVNDSASTDKHTAIDINVVANDSDPDGDPVSVSSINTTGTKGSVSVNPNGTIHYDPNGQFTNLTQGQTATDSFTYTDTDGFQSSSPATVTVTINGVNDPPVLSNIETTPVSYRAQDPGTQITNTLTISDDDDGTIGSATASITSGFSAAQDSLQFTNQNGITGSYNSSTGVLALTGNASIANYETALHSIDFFTSDGSVTPANRTVSFAVTDSVGATSTTSASRTINVAEANQPPAAVNHSYTAVGNTPLGVGTSPAAPAATQTGSLLNGDSDPDSADPISVTANSTPAHGTVSVNPDGTFTYTPAAGFSGTDSFTYTVTDSDDPLNPKSATATATITVGPVVWYVDDSKSAAGNGEAGSPFNTLAAANSAAGANSIIFLYQGNATYTGGASMKSGEDLFGQPHGLTVDGFSLVTAGGSNPTITNSGGDGIDLAEGADVEGVNVSNPSGNGIGASSVNNATVGGSNAVAISGAGGNGISVSGGSGTLNFGTTSVTGSTGHSVSLASRTGGTTSLGGSITDHGTGVSLSGNTGATINFSGTLSISTGTNSGFSASGGGTVTATGTGSTITTTTATALNVSSTTIGSNGLKFQSISAGTSASGPSNGIVLSSTGSSGGLTVTGSGTTAGSGGTIQKATTGVSLSSTSSPSFTDMLIENNSADGINGSQVGGLTLAGSTVSGNGTKANVSVENNDGLDFSPNGTGSPNGLTGTVSITNSTITGSADNNAVISDSSGTLNLTVTGSTFSNDQTNDGIHVDSNGSTNATVSVTGSTFIDSIGDHFQFSTNSVATGTNNVTFSNNTLSTDSHPSSTVLGGGMVISPDGTSSNKITIDNNNIQNDVAGGIGVDDTDAAGITGSVSGTISGNTVGSPTVAGSGSSQADDIGINADGSSTETLAITNNNLYQYENIAGIHVLNREGNATQNMTITGNTIADPGQTALSGLFIQAGATSGPPADSGKVCAAISGNSMTGSAPSVASGGISDFFLRQRFSTTIELPGYTGANNNNSAVVSFVQGNNTPSGGSAPSGTATNTVGSGGGGFVGGTSCPTPS